MKNSNLTISYFVICLVIVVSQSIANRAEAAPDAKKPNILWLVTEDMGPEQACYGHPEVFTPTIDRLAAEGVRYANAFTVTPVCSTSRSSFMTGMNACSIGAHQHRTPSNRHYVSH